MSVELKDIYIPTTSPTYSDVITSGPKLLPQKIVQTYESKEWEIFTEECAFCLKDIYADVKRSGGAGDQGIDVAAFVTEAGFDSDWDNYQCKHYNHPLQPTDIIKELGKVCYYTFTNEYTVPRTYYFVAPQGVGTTLGKMLRGKHEDLRKLLINKWTKYCATEIIKEQILLDGEFLSYVESFDFSIFKDITVLRLLEIHSQSPNHRLRFGGGLPPRPIAEVPPDEIAALEQTYIRKLLSAYAEYLGKDLCTHEDINGNNKLKTHLKKARIQFYCAESLNKFSRDYLVAGEYERLQDNFLTGIENIIMAEHKHGYDRVVAAVQEAYKLQIDFHPLKDRVEILDRGGICHQLANEDKLSWANKEQNG